jgi:hypothetical protein
VLGRHCVVGQSFVNAGFDDLCSSRQTSPGLSTFRLSRRCEGTGSAGARELNFLSGQNLKSETARV